MDLTPKGKIRCPKDATIMEKIGVGRHMIEHCGRCGAMWFDAYELESILNQKTDQIIDAIDYGTAKHRYTNDEVLGGHRQCPRDQTPLLEIPDPRQPHVKIDLCKTCGGLLLDAGELKDLSEFTLAERVRAMFTK